MADATQLTPEAFQARILQKYPDGVASDGTAYKDMSALELTQRIVNKFPDAVTNDGHKYSDFLGNEKTRADSESKTEFKPTFAADTSKTGLAAWKEPLKTVGNVPSSAFQFTKGAVNFLNPVRSVPEAAKSSWGIATGVPGLIKDSSYDPTYGNKNSKQAQAYTTQLNLAQNMIDTQAKEAIGQHSTATSLLNPVSAENPSLGRALTDVVFGSAKGTYEAVVPKAAQQLVKGNTQGAQRTITNDPVGQIAPFIFAAKEVAPKATDSFVTKTARPVTAAGEVVMDNVVKPSANYAFNKVSGAAGKVKEFAGNAAAETGSKLTGVDRSTFRTAAENPEVDFSKVDRATLGQEVQSTLNKHAASLEEAGKGYEPIRQLKTIDKTVSPETTKVIKNGKTSYVYDLKDAPNEKLTLPELRQKANLLEADKSGTYKPSELKAVKDLITKKEIAEPVDHTVTVKPKYVESTIKKTTGLTLDKEGKLQTSGSASIRDPKDVRALQNLLDTWKPVFEKGKMTTTEYLNFRSDLGKLSKFDREISRSQALENLAKQMYGDFNSTYRQQIPGLAELDESFSTQKQALKEMTKGLVDKNGNLTDSGLTKIARATENRPQLMAQLEKIDPNISKKIKILQAAEDLRAASEKFKVGTYSKTAGIGGLVFGAAHFNIPLMVGSLVEMVLTNPENATKLVQRYSKLAEKSSPYRQVLNGAYEKLKTAGMNLPSVINQLPEKRPAKMKRVNVFGKQIQLTP